jgi:hypothetical protein
MKVAPRVLVALLVSLSAAGCRTAGTDSIAHSRPPQPRLQTAFDVEEFVAEHNRNSARIRSLEAKPSISAAMGPQGNPNTEGHLDGRLALERPRNFKLELSHIRSTVADIGSNNERFWFWVQSKKDKSVYVCDYADLRSTTLAVTYQPDWIVEAMGLKAIKTDEAALIKSRPGPQLGTTTLVFPPAGAGGRTYSRIMIVSDETRRVKEFRVLSSDGKIMIAQATIKKYRELPASGSGKETGSVPQTCYLPEIIVLDWKREQLSLDVTLKDVKINQFDPARRTALFVEPAPSGYAKVNLAELTRQNNEDNATAIRETMPAPEPRNQVRLSPPLQVREEERDRSSAKARRAQPNTSKGPVLLPVFNLEEVVGAPVPTAPGSESERALTSSAIYNSPSMSMER